jgi:butyrate kinase
VLAVNPGSTTTKAVLYEDERVLAGLEVEHRAAELEACGHAVYDQLDLREAALVRGFADKGVDPAAGGLDAVAGRGGLLRPMPGGVYAVGEAMLDDLRHARYGEHACNLGAELAVRLAARWGGPGCPAVITDPVVTDELLDAARVTGLPPLRRRSLFHALSQRGAAREAARRLGLAYEEGDFLVLHLGGGVSVGAHCRGRVADVTNALDGEGPFSPERSGGVPLMGVLDLLESGATTIPALRRAIVSTCGLKALLGTKDLRRIEAMAVDGTTAADGTAAPGGATAAGGAQLPPAADAPTAETARRTLEAMAYAMARTAYSLLPTFVLAHGRAVPPPGAVPPTEAAGLPDVPTPDAPPARSTPVDAVVLTGGMARSAWLTAALTRYLERLGPVVVVTGLEEMQTLADGARRMLLGRTRAEEYLPAP